MIILEYREIVLRILYRAVYLRKKVIGNILWRKSRDNSIAFLILVETKYMEQ